ncbi:hypothetical protein AB0D33_17710 [Streptomyces sp. NPDC048404]|uniref:hypothetical protein n=1 Tax=unclassified Streptomyces TaxID=2593676 RepID=UPI003428B345
MNQVKNTVGAIAATVPLGAFSVPAVAMTSSADTAAANPAYRILKHLDYSGPGKASLRVGYYDRTHDKGFGWNKVRRRTTSRSIPLSSTSPNLRTEIGSGIRRPIT